MIQHADQTVRWSYDQEGTLIRVDPSGEQSHKFRGIGVTGFAAQHQAVVIEIANESCLCPIGLPGQGGRP